MKDLNSEQNKKKNNAVSDDALNDVSGGVNYIQMGEFAATFQTQAIGCKVRVINGKSCPSCGGTIGKIALGSASSGVTCEKCNKLILENYTTNDIEII